MNTLTINKSSRAVDLTFTAHKMTLLLEDGRELSVPLEWFPRLKNSDPELLKEWRFIGKGEGIHWIALDEDILIKNLF